MKKQKRLSAFPLSLLVLLCCAVSMGALTATGHLARAASESAQIKLRVGTYDPRAIAAAYARSDLWNKQLAGKMQEHKQAKADGDEKKVKELEAWGDAQQRRLHRQGFGNEPVDNILAFIKDDLPKVAQDAKVVLIVPKADWHDEASVEVVDVTDRMVDCLNPTVQTRQVIAELRKHAPVDLGELDKQH